MKVISLLSYADRPEKFVSVGVCIVRIHLFALDLIYKLEAYCICIFKRLLHEISACFYIAYLY
jgi:hypothetical protein